MSKRSPKIPQTRVKKPEPPMGTEDWIIWAAWADRITFEEIRKKSGLRESQVIEIMRKRLKPRSFKLWRARASQTSHKHQKLFKRKREMDSLN